MNARKWTIADLVDFEYFLSLEGGQPDKSAQQRDRRIFLESIEPLVKGMSPGSDSYRRGAFRLWLEDRRSLVRTEDSEAVLPGEGFREARVLLCVSIAVLGLLSGAATALALLTYTGHTAVNVTAYLGVLVFLQLAGLLAMFRFLFVRTSMDRLRKYSLLYGLLSRSLERMVSRLVRATMDRAGGRRRADIREASGFLRGMYGIYGHVLFLSLIHI